MSVRVPRTATTTIELKKPEGKDDGTEEEAMFYCMEHDMFLCKNCFDDHLNHKGAESIKNHLPKEFNLWNSLLSRILEIEAKLKSNVNANRNIIDVLRNYYIEANSDQDKKPDFSFFGSPPEASLSGSDAPVITEEQCDAYLKKLTRDIRKPVSLFDLTFIDVVHELPGVINLLKMQIKQLKLKVTQFCKQQNLAVVFKMRDLYCIIAHKLKELDMRVSMPLCVGIYMLQQLKKQLISTTSKLPQTPGIQFKSRAGRSDDQNSS